MRYLGVDYGSRRIGLAVGDDALRIATPLRTLAGRGQAAADAEAVTRAAREAGAEAIVVGLPINMNDTLGPQAQATRAFIAALRRVSGLEVREQDERLSSFAADEALAAAGQTRRDRGGRRDRLAACVILQSYLDALPGGPGPS